MILRRFSLLLLAGALAASVACSNKKVQNPIANVNSAQPDKVLFDRAMDAMKHNRFDVARISLQTLINTYPDSEYIARAKLAIGDSWYAEGGSAAWAQAESEYKDFETFFPNMPEAAEAQFKIGNIHYQQMEKPDRDYTHAKRAEDEYRQMILQYPDSKLVPQAKQRLREVQEVLGEREFRIGRFYYMRQAWPAAIARLQSLVDAYPLYSQADEALYMLGNAHESEASLIRASRFAEAMKGQMIKDEEDKAAAAYSRILTRYPVMGRAGDARKRLEAMHRPVPTATPEALAENKAEQASRGKTGLMGQAMANFRKNPIVAEASKVGDPTLTDPKQTGAPEVVRQMGAGMLKAAQAAQGGGTNQATVETVKSGAGPGENQPVPRSEPTPGTAPSGVTSNPTAPQSKDTGIQDLTPSVAPAAGAAPSQTPGATDSSSSAPAPAPQQVNDTSTSSSSSSSTNNNANQDSSSKSKKKKGLRKLIPF